MKIYRTYFSPTATSAKISKAIADEAASALKAEVVDIDVTKMASEAIEISKGELAIIAAPVYGGSMAPISKARMEAIAGKGTHCALVAVYGNRAFEHALADMVSFAEAHGFTPIAAGAFVGEHSYSTPQTPIATGRPDADDLKSAAEFGKGIAAKILSGDMSGIEATSLGDIPSPEKSLENFRKFVTEYAARQKANPVKLLPIVDVTICTHCGICVAGCPTQAIADDCQTVDPAKCIKCCACVKSCPQGARTLRSPFAPVLSANFSMRKAPAWLL